MRKILVPLLVICSLILSCSLGKSQNNQDINSLLEKIDNYQEHNNYKKANILLDSLIIRYPENAELYFRLAHSKTLSEPSLLEIMNLLEKCLYRDSLHYKAMYLKSQGFMFMEYFKGALQVENILIENYPDLFLLKADRVSTYLFNGDFEIVIDEVQKLLPICAYIEEAERLIRVRIYANYFLGNTEAVIDGKAELANLGFNVDYLNKLIDDKSLKFEEFAKGKNVGNTPCSLSQLRIMFPDKTK